VAVTTRILLNSTIIEWWQAPNMEVVDVSSFPWLSNYPSEIRPHLEYPTSHLTEFLQQSAEHYPHHNAIHFLGKTLTYQQLLEHAYRFANGLTRLGVKKGDRVAIMLPNIPQYVICYYGVLFAGGIVVQTNPLYVSHDLTHLLSDSGAETIVCLDLVYPRVKAVKDGIPAKNIIVTSIKDFLPFPKNMLYPIVQKRKGPYVHIDYKTEPVIPLQKLLRESSAQPVAVQTDAVNDIAVLQYTGGTTGLAKGVMLTHSNLTANVTQCREWMYKTEEGKETILTVVPLFHVYGMNVCMNYGISIGARLVLIPKFEIELLMKSIDTQRPTLFPGAPTLYIAIINYPQLDKYDLSSINCCISGSASLPMEVQEKFEQLTQGKIVEGYGLSEASPVTHVNPIWGLRKNGSIGIPWPDTESRIVDESGEPLKPGEIGEIAVRGPQVMKGYWNHPEETAAVLKDGWLYTGDMGYMDEEGYFYVVDRKKDVIIAAGFKVYPREIEEVLYQHPAVLEAVVIGVSDPYRGETVKAYIVFKEGRQVSDAALNVFCRSKLAAYKVPRLYEFRKELPKSMIGKILRRVLVEEEKARGEK
jgi:long-chain acyl-CoA synthetase